MALALARRTAPGRSPTSRSSRTWPQRSRAPSHGIAWPTATSFAGRAAWARPLSRACQTGQLQLRLKRQHRRGDTAASAVSPAANARAARASGRVPRASTWWRSTPPPTAAWMTPAICVSGPCMRRRATIGARCAIVDEAAHMLTRRGTLRTGGARGEPPPRVVFVFATTEPGEGDRCSGQRRCSAVSARFLDLGLKTVPWPTSGRASVKVHGVAMQNVKFDPDALAMISRAADGSMRDALSLTDQVLSMGDGEVSPERVREALGLVPEDEFLALLDLVAERRAGDVFSFVARLADAVHRLQPVPHRLRRHRARTARGHARRNAP